MDKRELQLGLLAFSAILFSSCGTNSVPQDENIASPVGNKTSVSGNYQLTQITTDSLKELGKSDPKKANYLEDYLNRERNRGANINLSPSLDAQQTFSWYYCTVDIDIFDNSPINNTAGGYYKSQCNSNYIVRAEHTLQVYNEDTADIIDTERVTLRGSVAYGTSLRKTFGFDPYCAFGMIVLRFNNGTYWQASSDPVCQYMYG